jgi:AraC-like DNA-binding protein
MTHSNFSTEKSFDFGGFEEVRLIFCGKMRKSGGHKYDPHKRNHFLLSFIEEGSASFSIEGKEITLHKNCFYVMHPKSEMSYVADPNSPWSIAWIILQGNKIEEILNSLGLTRETPYVYLENIEKAKRILSELYEKTGKSTVSSGMKSLSLLYDLFSLLSKEKAPKELGHAEKGAAFMQAHFSEGIRVSDVAKYLHMNSNYFSKLFKSKTGMSPADYLHSLRNERALQLLVHTDMSIAEISEAIGFSDPFYFSRWFKKINRCSPVSRRKEENGF